MNIKADTVKMELTGEDISSDGLKGVNIAKAGAKLTIDGKLDITANGDNNTIGVYNQGDVVVNGDVSWILKAMMVVTNTMVQPACMQPALWATARAALLLLMVM